MQFRKHRIDIVDEFEDLGHNGSVESVIRKGELRGIGLAEINVR